MTPKTRALVDSGCDVTSFPKDWAAALGIDWNACTPFSGLTASGADAADPATQPRLWVPGVDAIFIGVKIHLQAVFRPGLPVILLGREDFFTYFRVTFDQAARVVTVEPY